MPNFNEWLKTCNYLCTGLFTGEPQIRLIRLIRLRVNGSQIIVAALPVNLSGPMQTRLAHFSVFFLKVKVFCDFFAAEAQRGGLNSRTPTFPYIL